MTIKSDMKFVVNSPEINKKLQDALFKAGYSWYGSKEYKNIDCKFLFAYSGGTLSYTNNCEYFNSHENKLCDAAEYIVDSIDKAKSQETHTREEFELVKVMGKLYLKEKVEEALSKLDQYKFKDA